MVVGDTSLVLHGIKRSCDSLEVESITNEEIDIIENISCLSIKSCLERLKKSNNISNKAIIKKLELYLDSLDNYKYERDLRKTGITLIGGVDEVGRGPLVGPVVAACCVLPENFNLDGLTDSKKLSEKKRDYYFEEIKKQAITYGIGIVDEKRIDEINIYQATKEAMIIAINNCKVKPQHVLTDAMKLDIDIPTTPIIKGDLKSITISAASVLAKVTRDRMMYELDKLYPMYDFKNNVGYPTKTHLEAINKYGIIKEHRRSYGPVKDYIESKNVK
ncbi:MAG: ribonuclease HII [Bacilli bacterium]|nr:ribonuclease HII [Bacilli bacterium]